MDDSRIFRWGNTVRKLGRFLKKIAKMHYFMIFFKQFNKPCFTFPRIWMKIANCWEMLRKLWKYLIKNSIEQLKFIFIFMFILKILLPTMEPSEITPDVKFFSYVDIPLVILIIFSQNGEFRFQIHTNHWKVKNHRDKSKHKILTFCIAFIVWSDK